MTAAQQHHPRQVQAHFIPSVGLGVAQSFEFRELTGKVISLVLHLTVCTANYNILHWGSRTMLDFCAGVNTLPWSLGSSFRYFLSCTHWVII